MSEAGERKRRRGDRADARLVKVAGLQTIMGYLFPRRTESEVYMFDTLDATELMAYLEKKNALHPEYRTTLFHCLVVSVARVLRERPKMNRYMQGWRTYERDEISISFIAKRLFADGAEEALMTVIPKDEDTLDSVSRYIFGDLTKMRKSEHSVGGIDQTIDRFAKLPRLLLAPFIRLVRILDFWGFAPRAFREGNTNYTSVLLSNLGSVKGPAVYHHLNNYGTNSVLGTLGTFREEPVLQPDGTVRMRWLVDYSFTLDERIADGFYFARSLKLLKHIFENPELLDLPLGEPSGFSYE